MIPPPPISKVVALLYGVPAARGPKASPRLCFNDGEHAAILRLATVEVKEKLTNFLRCCQIMKKLLIGYIETVVWYKNMRSAACLALQDFVHFCTAPT